MSIFNYSLLSDFIHGFWVYGIPEGDYWFVGMEEGGGAPLAGLQ